MRWCRPLESSKPGILLSIRFILLILDYREFNFLIGHLMKKKDGIMIAIGIDTDGTDTMTDPILGVLFIAGLLEPARIY